MQASFSALTELPGTLVGWGGGKCFGSLTPTGQKGWGPGSQLTVPVGAVAGGRDGPLFAAKLLAEHATGQLSPGLPPILPPSPSSSSAREAWLLTR